VVKKSCSPEIAMFSDIVHFQTLVSQTPVKNQKLWDFNMTYEHHEQPPLFMGSGGEPAPAGEISSNPDWEAYLNSESST
jgi:hypothetical protein